MSHFASKEDFIAELLIRVKDLTERLDQSERRVRSLEEQRKLLKADIENRDTELDILKNSGGFGF